MWSAVLAKTNLAFLPNTCDQWRDQIMAQKSALGVRKVAIIQCEDGQTRSRTSGFVLPVKEVTKLPLTDADPDRMVIKGTTYMRVKERSYPDQWVGFNGSAFCVVSKSKKFYVVVVGKTASKRRPAAQWLHKLTQQLIEHGS